MNDQIVLALNVGSSSLKFQLNQKKTYLFSGEIENLGAKQAKISINEPKHKPYFKALKTLKSAVAEIQKICLERGISTVQIVSHRMVFGGDKYIKPTKLTEKVIKDLLNFSFIAPLHIPNEIEVAKESKKLFPKALQIACFDTSFHKNLPDVAMHLPLLDSYFKKGVKKFGFHGLSYESVVHSLKLKSKRVVVAHLGSGASVCAIDRGKSIETSMGFTPLGGIMMGTRPGDLDPGVLLYMLKQEKMDLKSLEQLLNHNSGFMGLARSQDVKKLLARDDEKSKLAIDMFCYQVAKKISEYLVVLKKIDVIVFTGAIGYRSSKIRRKICQRLAPLGVKLGPEIKKNDVKCFSAKTSQIDLYAFETNEEDVLVNQALKYV